MITERFGKRGFTKSVDWVIIVCYLLLIFIGWINIFASSHVEDTSIFDFSTRSGKQFVWILSALLLIVFILFVLPPGTYESISIPSYVIVFILLVAVSFVGGEHKGSHSWFDIGPFAFQPAEISKITTSIVLASVMGKYGFKISKMKDFITSALIIILPMAAILLENETGSALVYAGFIFVLYREGFTGWIIFIAAMAVLLFIVTLVGSPYWAILICSAVVTLCNSAHVKKLGRWFYIYLPVIIAMIVLPFAKEDILLKDPLSPIAGLDPTYILLGASALLIPVYSISAYKNKSIFIVLSILALIVGIGFIFSSDFIFDNVLQDHQRMRIEVLLGLKEDPHGVGYNVRQSMISIGSGGLFGKGFLKGTQTTFGFVPEQTTDFIFCTVGEEWGFVGCTVVILLYVILIWRILSDAEKSREGFTRIYGYCVASCLFMHLFINVGMTIGLMPVIGIPLPLLSYGGSSLWAFSILIFIFVALDRNENKYF